MQVFEIIVGLTSIGSFVVSIIALVIVNDVKKKINKNYKNKQIINKSGINNSKVVQVGKDCKGE